ncbi:MAG: hypothetical protein JO022_11600 [Acidobacteriaceae bacterium]|nr:hypothetical protein [Acidobacteriaceae bacterium]
MKIRSCQGIPLKGSSKIGVVLLIAAAAATNLLAVESKPAPSGSVLEAQVVQRYLTAAHEQQNALRGASMEVEIHASVPKLQREGRLQALRNISRLGKVTYRMLGFNGDNAVKKEVIARYLTADVQGQSGPDIAITPANYKFKLKGVRDASTHPVYVLSVSPRKKEVGLFRGEIWVDQETSMPIRESGRFVKNPSILLKRMEFVRTYELQDGLAVPKRVESTVATRLFGPVQLTIGFTHLVRDPDAATNTVASLSETQE